MGASGVGKSAVMAELARHGSFAAADGDDFHRPANVAKMAAGIALTDDDRLPWLRAIRDWLRTQERAGVDAVVACSALRRAYRDVLRDGNPNVRFVHLTADRAVIEERLARRTGHYMPASLLASQLETLEPLAADESGFTVVADRPPGALADEILDRLGRNASESREVARPEGFEPPTY